MPEWMTRLDDRFPWLIFLIMPLLAVPMVYMIVGLAWLASWPF